MAIDLKYKQPIIIKQKQSYNKYTSDEKNNHSDSPPFLSCN